MMNKKRWLSTPRELENARAWQCGGPRLISRGPAQNKLDNGGFSLSLSSLFSLCLCLSWDRAGCARVGFPQASGTPHLHCRHAPSLLLCQARVRCSFLLYQLSHTRPFADNAVLFAESFSLSLSFFVFSLTFSNAVEVTVPFSNPSF